MSSESVKTMWTDFLQTVEKDESKGMEYTAWAFGSDEHMARELADLVKVGEKTATTSLYLLYELENEPIPKIGEYNIITDWNGEAEAITVTVDVRVMPFNHVSSAFAYKEGEGDKSLEYWKRVHIEFFANELAGQEMEFKEDMLVVCEEFKVVYK